jgi:hypothetical protein
MSHSADHLVRPYYVTNVGDTGTDNALLLSEHDEQDDNMPR